MKILKIVNIYVHKNELNCAFRCVPVDFILHGTMATSFCVSNFLAFRMDVPKIFETKLVGQVSFSSKWQNEIVSCDQELQTINTDYKDGWCQYPDSQVKDVQTCDEVLRSDDPASTEGRLPDFLATSLALLHSEVNKSLRLYPRTETWFQYASSDSFLSLRPLVELVPDQLESFIIDRGYQSSSLVVGSIAWNRAQTSLIVAYKFRDHPTWCVHESFLMIWSLFQFGNKPMKPSHVIQTEGCVTSISAHPLRSSIYSLGFQSGKVVIMDTRALDSDLIVNATPITASFSRQNFSNGPIIGFEWLKNRFSNKKGDDLFVSFSKDGFIIKWLLQNQFDELKIVEIYTILLMDYPKSMNIKNSSPHWPGQIHSFAFNLENTSYFVVGCEGGSLFSCSLDGTYRKDGRLQRVSSEDLVYRNPIIMNYAQHRARVEWISFSPKKKNIFSTSARDQEMRIWNFSQATPLYVLHCQTNFLTSIFLNGHDAILSIGEDGSYYVSLLTNENRLILKNRSSYKGLRLISRIWMNNFQCFDQISVIDEEQRIHLLQIEMGTS
ncbi:cytoplasmic dynein 2 intermediate chain 2-like [Brevipalpus obovatus]|uniref:cytoplasmic dynein 2 intermediate chain 2-like n=1 Tax=Brevipalpus obovatus TaxID=246614 RepID=UPI003D9F5D30